VNITQPFVQMHDIFVITSLSQQMYMLRSNKTLSQHITSHFLLTTCVATVVCQV